jgi:hypothetical protein
MVAESHTTEQKGESIMNIRIKILTILAAALVAVGWPHTGLAQSQPANVKMAVQISEARKANAALMRQYTWESRTELIEAGQVKDVRIEAVSYGPDGQQQRSLLNAQGSPLPESLLGRLIAEKRKERLEAYVKGLRGLLEQYSLPTETNVLNFMNQAATTQPDANGLILISGSSVLLPGDNLSIWIEASTRQTHKAQVRTFYEGEAVQLTATYKTLASGLNYVAYADATIPGKLFTMQVQNYDYTRKTPAPPPQITEQKLPPSTAATPSPPIQERQISPSITEMEIKSPTPPSAPKTAPGPPSLQVIEQKLRDLKTLFDQGLITQSEYDAKKAQILQGL